MIFMSTGKCSLCALASLVTAMTCILVGVFMISKGSYIFPVILCIIGALMVMSVVSGLCIFHGSQTRDRTWRTERMFWANRRTASTITTERHSAGQTALKPKQSKRRHTWMPRSNLLGTNNYQLRGNSKVNGVTARLYRHGTSKFTDGMLQRLAYPQSSRLSLPKWKQRLFQNLKISKGDESGFSAERRIIIPGITTLNGNLYTLSLSHQSSSPQGENSITTIDSNTKHVSESIF